MAKRKVTIYECDVCGETDTPEDLEKRSPIPQGWLDLSGTNNHGCVFDLTICAECEDAIHKTIVERKEQSNG